jgi:uncharacterized Ntn-hydrolase superfamily protein
MTFTVIARQQGLLGIAQCTSAVAVGGRCPFIRANVGAVCTQAHTDPGLGPLAIELLTLGHSPEKVLKDLAETDPDFAWRQVGIVDRHGRVAVHTGSSSKDHKGSIVGTDYLVMGNNLNTGQVVENMNRAFLDSAGHILEDRLLAAITAGRDAPGSEDAIDAMTKLMENWRPLIPYYKEKPHRPQMAGWRDWLKNQGVSL